MQFLDETSEQQSGVVIIIGEAGSGKSLFLN
jgi:GTPase Era involved in 16S rRNA processing